MEFVDKAAALSTIVFFVSSMLAVGLNLTVGQVITPLRNARLVTFALLANFVLMPLAAMAIARLLQLDESLSGALLLLGTAPLVLPLLLSGVSVDPGKIASSLLLLMLLPLGIGLAVKSGLESIANRIEPLFSNVSKFALVLLILLMFVANIQKIQSLYGFRGVLASILLLVAGSMMGWFLGGPAVETRSVMALGTAQPISLLHWWLLNKTSVTHGWP